ncbi:MAG: hypothetical protein ACOH1X_11865 [Kaistella sp.]
MFKIPVEAAKYYPVKNIQSDCGKIADKPVLHPAKNPYFCDL